MRILKKIWANIKPKRKHPAKPLELVFTDKFGNRYYRLKDLTQLSYERFIQAEISTRQAEFCLTREDTLTLLGVMKAKANEGNIVEVFSLITELEQRLNFAGEVETLLLLASVYFMNDTEDIDKYRKGEQIEKINTWRKDDEALCFFLNAAWQHTKNYTITSVEDIIPYLTEALQSQSQINSILQTPSMVISTN